MFTGLIAARGIVRKITPAAAADAKSGAKIQIGILPANSEFLRDVKIGDSIAADGVCLTAEIVAADCFSAALSPETLARCAPFCENAAVNLELPLAVGDRLGGHFVSGHIEGVAKVAAITKTEDGGRQIVFSPPPELQKFIIPKGSVALAGVSLTVNEINDSESEFSVQIIPHTLAHTTLANLAPGDSVNLETDILARHLHKLTGGEK